MENYNESVWEHLAGTKSMPFEAGEYIAKQIRFSKHEPVNAGKSPLVFRKTGAFGYNQIAVKVIDDRGNELMVVKDLKEVKD